LSISSVFIVPPRSLRSSQAVTVGSPLSTVHLPRPDPARGIFETLLVVEGRPVELDAHLDRLAASARELFGPPAMARVAGPARALAEARARGSALARLRLTLAPDERGALDLSAVTADVEPATVFPTGGRGTTLAAVCVAGGLGRHKWADRDLLERVGAELDGALPLIVDADGSVLEAERANVFAVRDGALATPPDDGRILPGIARARTIEVARGLGVALREEPLTLPDLEAADEAFLTGSIRGVEPVRGPAADGGLTARLAAALRERWLGHAP
jgi:para-aminobenzoate synthetase/4-amino-4-deoxychorismate lyase